LIETSAQTGITGQLIDALVDKILIFPDRKIEVTFRFDNGFDRIDEVIACA
jgi:hypothetical protein